MSEWVSNAPAFAVVGKINMGKSSVLATLLEIDDDHILRVSSTPGETTRCLILPVEYDGREMMRFIDTPGFSNALEAMRVIQERHGKGSPNLETIKQFVHAELDGGKFADEARLLEPIVEGAGVLYVIDPSKPLRDDFIAEMEILRWTGCPRMALLNEKASDSERLSEWRSRLGSYFNLVRTFNAHRAQFAERTRLLKSLLEIDESRREQIEETITFIEQEWDQRREQSADEILDCLSRAMAHRESVPLDQTEEEIEERKLRKLEEVTQKYYGEICKIEEKTYTKFLKIYRHQTLSVDVTDRSFEGVDLSSEETWQKWGLSRKQITLVGGVAGGAAGLLVDVGSAGFTHGWGTLLGTIGGASAAFLKGDSLPDLKIGELSADSKKALVVGPPSNLNFPFILLDHLLYHYAQVVCRAHGKREEAVIGSKVEPAVVKTFSRKRNATFQKWFSALGKKDVPFDSEVYRELLEVLREVENKTDQ